MFNRLLPKNTLQLVLQRTYRVNNLILSPRRLFSAAEDLMLEKKAYAVNMPEIMEAKDGKVTKWLKDEGDEFHIGEAICEISTAGLTIAFEAERAGVLLQRLVYEGQVIEVNTPIAHAAIDKQAYMDYIDHKRVEAMEDAMQAEIKEEVEKKQEKSKKPDNLVLMREIKHLIQDGHIEDGSDFAKSLQSLARKGDSSLMSVFEASFDGVAFNKDTFDVKFFLENAQAIVNESK